MASLSSLLGGLNLSQAGAPVDIGSPQGTSEGRRFMRVSGVLFSGAHPASRAPFHPALLGVPIRFGSAAIQRWFSFVISPFALQNGAVKPSSLPTQRPNPAVEGTPKKPPLFASSRLARCPSLLR